MPDSADIGLINELFRELLAIRYSTPLFHLETAQEVMDKVAFHNTGPDQIPGLLVMTITDRGPGSLDSNVNELVILINATPEEQTFRPITSIIASTTCILSTAIRSTLSFAQRASTVTMARSPFRPGQRQSLSMATSRQQSS